MRLLIDVRALTDRRQGGVARVALELIKSYAAKYPDDELICLTTGQNKPNLPTELTEFKNIKHAHIRIFNKLWGLLSWLNLVSLIKKAEERIGKIDHSFFPNLGFMGSCRNKNYILLLHDLSFLIEPRWFSWKERAWHRLIRAHDLIRKAKHLLAVSETTKQDAVRLLGISPEQITVIPIGSTSVAETVSTDERTPYQGHGHRAVTDNRYALSIGAGDPRKNSATAIKAVSLLRRESGFEDLKMVLIGRPYAVRSTQYDVDWLHHVFYPTDAELAELYAHASAFLYPSWYEGYGLPLHEAASFGTPCIASTSGALPETAPAGTIFANPAKPHHWVEALKIALIKRNEPLSPKADTWLKAAEVMKEKMQN